MGKIFIVCPECRQQLSFTEVPGYQNMVVECPRCHFKANASVYQSGAQARGGQGADDDSTHLVNTHGLASDTGQIRVKESGEIKPLKTGSNVIGRHAQSGTADIQISDDKFMSRRHVQIDVVKKPGGYAHHLVELNSKNVVVLNGKPINRGDILVLKFGDVLTLGTTDVILEPNDEDATELI